MRRLQRRWNREKRFSTSGEIPRSSLMNMDLGGEIDSRSVSRTPGHLDGDVQLPKMLP